jgi:hypothetical protein
MNLSSTLVLYAGGPGSGCNPEKGKCGRPPRTVSINEDALRAGEKSGEFFLVGHINDADLTTKILKDWEKGSTTFFVLPGGRVLDLSVPHAVAGFALTGLETDEKQVMAGLMRVGFVSRGSDDAFYVDFRDSVGRKAIALKLISSLSLGRTEVEIRRKGVRGSDFEEFATPKEAVRWINEYSKKYSRR